MQLEPDQLAEIVATAIKSASAPLLARIVQLERKELPAPKDGAPGTVGPQGEMGLTGPKGDQGEPGRDADPAVILELKSEVESLKKVIEYANSSWTLDSVKQLVHLELEKLPPAQAGKDGASVTLEDVQPLVNSAVDAAVAALPVPQDGRSVTIEDVVPVIASEVQKAVAALPAAKDGVGVAGAFIDRDGRLVLTLSDGATKELGAVVGKDADQSVVAALILAEVAKIPRPKDGQDGLGFEDMEPVYDEHGRLLLRFVRGERVKEFRVPGIVDRGVWKAGEVYLKGDGATWGGSFWIAQQETSAKPDGPGPESRAWRLSVKKGAEGKTGQQGEKGMDGKAGRDGKDGQWR